MLKSTVKFFNSLPLSSISDPIVEIKLGKYILKAPKSFKDASEELRNTVTGGCGPGGIGDWTVPDTIYGLRVTLACQIHDWTFQIWNDDISFAVANNLFSLNLQAIIYQHKSWRILVALRLRRVKTYVWAVSGALGKNAYLDNHLKYLA